MADLPTIDVPTLDAATEELRATLAPDSPINNRDPYGVFEAQLGLAAQAKIDGREVSAALIPQVFPLTATGLWLDRHAESLGMVRIPERRAEHDVYFAVSGPGTVPVGSVVQTELSADGQALRFVALSAVKLTAPGGLVRMVAESPGTRYNAGPNRIIQLVTVLPFVTSVSNSATSLAVAGVDRETDAQLQQRLRLRWPAISRGSTYHAYIAWAEEVPGITKVRVLDQHPRGQGTVDVLVAPDAGLPTAAQVAAVQALVDARRPVGVDAQARAPAPKAQNVAVTIFRASTNTESAATWTARIQAVLDAQGIGDTFYPSRIADALHNFAGVLGVTVTLPAAPVQPAEGELVVSGAIAVGFG